MLLDVKNWNRQDALLHLPYLAYNKENDEIKDLAFVVLVYGKK